MTAHHGPIAVPEFDAAPPADAAAELVPCCGSRRWVSSLVKNRPYASLSRLSSASDGILAALSWPDLLQALLTVAEAPDQRAALGTVIAGGSALHPRPGPDDHAFANARSSYFGRFGYPFLICPSGLSGEEMLSALRSRLGNDPVAEREVVRGELTKVVRLRLGKAFR